MFRRCIFDPIVCAAVFTSLLKCFCLNPGTFYNCSQDLCSTSLANRQCSVHHDECKCAQSSNNSSCDSLGQQTFVKLTGVPNANASEWTCCFCSRTESYCCDQCNTRGNASSYLRATTTFFRLLVVFILDCHKFLNEREKLATSIRVGIVNVTRNPFDSVTVENITCKTGQRPYCGVDVEHIRAHHRAKRLALGGRMRGSSSKKKNDGKINNYSQYGTVELACESFSANITVHGANASLLESKLNHLRFLQKSGTLAIPLWDGHFIYSSFMLSAMKSVSYDFHEAPEPTQRPKPPTEPMQPIELDLKPLLYAGGAMLGLVLTCVLWKFIKHTWLLKKKKFTSINSDRIDLRDAQRQQEVRKAMEENNCTTYANRIPFNSTLTSLRGSDSEVLSQHSKWSTPVYLPSMLTPAYKPTELHNQRSPPRLILDEGSDTENRQSVDNAGAFKLDDDNLSDILNSDDEIVLRCSAGRSTSIQGRDNPTYDFDNEKSRNPKSPRLVKGATKMSVTANDEVNRKVALQSDSDENDKTFLNLPVGSEKTKKKRDKRNKVKNSFDNNERRSSLRPPGNDEHLRRNSIASTGRDAKTRRVSLSSKCDEKDILTPRGREKKARRNSVMPEPKGSNSSTPAEDANLEEREKKQNGDGEDKRIFKEPNHLYKGPGKVSELKVKSITPETKRKNSAINEGTKKQKKRKRRKEAEKISRLEESDQERRKSSELSFIDLEANSITETRRKSSNVDYMAKNMRRYRGPSEVPCLIPEDASTESKPGKGSNNETSKKRWSEERGPVHSITRL